MTDAICVPRPTSQLKADDATALNDCYAPNPAQSW
eukprot:CAMPEP_0178427770 /NCGR_PEP_ID=MMETSP0689_2-20121128/29916_1 /TAXON_ID=160604 /ORGANISM="Amphidinium massartii, Strain CS-259" /LENGTH=34 /DNA_ID= /DNA_START= /DNA_END= /DNA_ORIENTATION=